MTEQNFSPVPQIFDVVIVGAGGAGMMCAIEAANRSRRVLLIDHGQKIGGKILISGGGRCNFTNLGASSAQYVSQNPHFCKSALSRFPSAAFVDRVEKYGISYHEKKLGQLFCDESARSIVALLKTDCDRAGAQFKLGCQIQKLGLSTANQNSIRFHIEAGRDYFACESLVIATGGLSIPKIGATDFGYRIARQFGLKIVETAPALDGFVFDQKLQTRFSELAGVSVDCSVLCHGQKFRENILFTHSGLSGPAALQASLHWNRSGSRGDAVVIQLLPDLDVYRWILDKKKEGCRSTLKNLLSEKLPKRLVEKLVDWYFPGQFELPLPQISNQSLKALCDWVQAWELHPVATVGYSKAEVTRGGVDTDELSSQSLESKKVPGLYFIGEVVDVTGWLGGYNFQWAWSSGWAAGQVC